MIKTTYYKNWEIEEHYSVINGRLMFYRVWVDDHCNDFIEIDDCFDFIDSLL